MELGHSLTDQNSFAARLLNAPGRAVEASNTNWRTGDRGKRLEWHSGWDWGNLKLFLKQQAIPFIAFAVFANQASMHAHSELQLRQAS
jgi:hypothetical protein